ncbi:DUF3788 domain-containing protein [Desulfitibacter alkalitolerans]|uniref:DUF3788 domain-containing protein n=1 Tax=Desulfitibacter alkalitolerans TaxID=264641 RepID=UPI0004815477|nr:DUF3788 domain-containing protein [Desulfitibacter alkalitolerans]
MCDLIQDPTHTPTFDEISSYINNTARALWEDMNTFIKNTYKAATRITYSKCSAKPGWNVKYQKSGKSLCTLYPEKESFVVLVVIKTDLTEAVEAMQVDYQPEVLEIVRTAKPFNGTLWLMIPVVSEKVLENVKQLLLLKHGVNTRF